MSDPGYGTPGGAYPPGNPYQQDPNWGGAPQPPQDPWHSPHPSSAPPGPTESDPWQNPPPASGPPGQSPYNPAPTSGAEYNVSPPPADYTQPAYQPPPPAGYGPPPAGGRPSDTRPLPLGPPASGPPGVMPPHSGPPGPPAAQKSGRGPIVPILAGATALLLVLGLVMTGLFIWKTGQQGDTQTKLTASQQKYNKDVTDRDQKIDELQGKYDNAQKDLSATKQQLEGTKSQLNATSDEKAVIAQCLKLVFEYIQAVANQNRSQANTLLSALDAPCRRAQVLIQ